MSDPPEHETLARRATRRTFLKYGAAGLGSATLAGTAFGRWPAAGEAAIRVDNGFLQLYLNEGHVRMVDGSMVYMRGFGTAPTQRTDAHPSLTVGPVVFTKDTVVASRFFPIDQSRLPKHPCPGRPDAIRTADGPGGTPLHLARRQFWSSYLPKRTIVIEEGTRLKLRIENRIGGAHEFAIDDVLEPQRIGTSGLELDLELRLPGTFIYHDSYNAPVERVLGSCGVILVYPKGQPWHLTADSAEFERQWIWIVHDIDSKWARRAAMHAPIDPEAAPPVPDYFTINDRSGFESIGVTDDDRINSDTHEETIAQGYARQTDVRNFGLAGPIPGTVITGQALRLVNTGVAAHQLHWHGNHVWTQRKNGRTFSRAMPELREGHIELQQWEDVVELDPLDRKDAILPVKPPPDVLDVVQAHQHHDWHYPMHCHAEMSQTAGGGLYPGGAVADWILAKPKPKPS